MKLHVVRHAAAEPREDYDRDSDRPLTGEGRSQMARTAEALKALGLAPSKILTSNFVRARETAHIVRQKLGGEVEEREELADPDRAGDVVELVCREAAEELMLVGHVPELEEVISLFIADTAETTVHLSKASCACIEFEESIAAGAGVLAWYVVPEIIKALS